jgi:hypothetical protein
MKSRGKSGDKKDKGKVPFGKHCRRAMVANVIFAMILIIWQTLAHKKESINKMLNQSFTQIKAF